MDAEHPCKRPLLLQVSQLCIIHYWLLLQFFCFTSMLLSKHLFLYGKPWFSYNLSTMIKKNNVENYININIALCLVYSNLYMLINTTINELTAFFRCENIFVTYSLTLSHLISVLSLCLRLSYELLSLRFFFRYHSSGEVQIELWSITV